MSSPDGFLAAVTAAVGARQVLTDPELCASYGRDWTGRFVGSPSAVVRPATTEEVAAVVGAAAAHHIALVPQGGNTGLVGGSVPLAGEVVVSTGRLDDMGPVDPNAGQITAGAGVTVGDVAAAARAAGWRYAVDFAARDQATIGGSVATNAGGVHVIRHGPTRQQVVGMEAVLGDGSVVSHLGGLLKDNTGYDLAGLLCGSEGTLGIVTRVRLRLVPPSGALITGLLAFDAVRDALNAVGPLRRRAGAVEACEFFLDEGLALVAEVTGAASPFARRYAAYLLLEVEADDEGAALARVLDEVAGLADVAVATDALRRRALWHHREAHTEAMATLGVVHKLDVTLPLDRLADFVVGAPALVASVDRNARCWLFGHAADGNVHVNVTGLAPDDDRVDDAVLTAVVERGGSISAEHGIGTAKRRWLARSRSPAEIAAFRAIKAALDPAGILNSAVLL